ncbi:MAG: hypothetical protein KAI16_01125 [Candidatus Pacebacteria bacterium]|nr:hypothetical protein [Candidatus Paceibacterota bacterium]
MFKKINCKYFTPFFLVTFYFLPKFTLAVSSITNPIQGFSTLAEFLEAIIKAITYLAIPFIVLAFIYSGFLFIKSQGSMEDIKKAKKALVTTTLATLIILGSNVILQIVTATTNQLLN